MPNELPNPFGPPKPPRPMIANVRYREAEAKRQKMLEYCKEGYRVTEAFTLAGFRTDGTYRMNRKRHPQWASQIDYALAANGDKHKARTDRVKEPSNHTEFVKRYFTDRDPPFPHQIQIADILDNLAPREIVMVLLWPTAGKTSTLEDYLCRRLATHPEHRFSYVSEATPHAKKIVGFTKRRMTDQSVWGEYIRRYGPFYEKGQERDGKPWAADEIMLARNKGTERDRNLVARSWTSAVYGSRIDTLILDDLQSQNNINQAQDIFDTIRGTFFSRDSKGNELRTLIIGTRIRQDDVYQKFLDAGLVTRQIILPAADPETGDPLVPEWWDRDMYHDGRGACCPPMLRSCPRNNERLTPREYMDLQRFQVGEDGWFSSYLQNPRANELSTFSEYLSRCYDHDRSYGPLIGV